MRKPIPHLLQLVGSLAALALFATACSNDLPKYTALNSLRVLALIADQPEVNPGTAVSVRLLLSDVNGEGRTLQYSARFCTDPGVAAGATPVCPEQENGVDTQVLGETTATGLTAATAYTAFQPAVTVTMPASVLDGASQAAQVNGVSRLFTVSVQSEDGSERIEAFTRIRASLPTVTQKNSNPSLTRVLVGDQILSASGITFTLPQVTTAFVPTLSAQSAETYSRIYTQETSVSTEEPYLTWFYSDGSFKRFRTVLGDENEYTPPSAKPTTRNSVIVVVVHDGRGGEDAQIYYGN